MENIGQYFENQLENNKPVDKETWKKMNVYRKENVRPLIPESYIGSCQLYYMLRDMKQNKVEALSIWEDDLHTLEKQNYEFERLIENNIPIFVKKD